MSNLAFLDPHICWEVLNGVGGVGVIFPFFLAFLPFFYASFPFFYAFFPASPNAVVCDSCGV